MQPEKGQQVQCFLRTSMVLKGIVEIWSDTQVVLRSLENDNLMIIHHPTEDILLTKVELSDIIKPTEKLSNIKQEISETLTEVLPQSQPSELANVSLKKLKMLVEEQERQIIKQKKQEHFGIAGNAKANVEYSEQKNLPFAKKVGK